MGIKAVTCQQMPVRMKEDSSEPGSRLSRTGTSHMSAVLSCFAGPRVLKLIVLYVITNMHRCEHSCL